jgi:hypothetical protein
MSVNAARKECVRHGRLSSTLVGQQAHGNSVTSREKNNQGTDDSLTVAVR